MIREYLALIKPERTMMNVLTAAAGYFFASAWLIDWVTFIALIAGSTSVIASANAFNNYFDRDIDVKMERTRRRVLVSGQVSPSNAVTAALLLGIIGFGLLSLTNVLTVAVIVVAYFSYVVVYGWAKRHTWHSTLIGTVPGGASLVAGYTAAVNQLDQATLILFLIMLTWQMVHFYSIAIYRKKEYAAAGVPLISITKGIKTTKNYMWFYLVIFVFSATFLTLTGYTGYIYLAGVLTLGYLWGRLALQGFKTHSNEQWARGMFKFSLIVLLAMSTLISVGGVLP